MKEKQNLFVYRKVLTNKRSWYTRRVNKHQFIKDYLTHVLVLVFVICVAQFALGHTQISVQSMFTFVTTIFWVSLLPIHPTINARLHDTGRSGWWSLLSLVPMIGSASMLFILLQPSEKHTNKWGDCPK